MRNPAVAELDELVGTWNLTLTNAWFLDSLEVRQHGARPSGGSARRSSRWKLR